MGKTIDNLRQIQQHREQCHREEHSAPSLRGAYNTPSLRGAYNTPSLRGTVGAEAIPSSPRKRGSESQVNTPRTNWPNIILLLLIVTIFTNLFFNAKLFSILTNNSKQSNNALTKINKLTQIVSKNEHTLNELSVSIKQNSSNFNSKLNELGDKLEAQDAAISNLTKAKDTIYKRVTELESKTKTSNRIVKVETSN